MKIKGAMENKLATLIESDSKLETFIATDKYLEFINQAPPKQWVKDHPMASGVKYLPIDKVELTLTKVFQEWYVEVLSASQLLNSIAITVRLFYKHPLSGWQHQDGVGAAPIQVDRGKNASDLGAIKNNAIMLALPAAKSYAIKDAAENIGQIFGGNINRKDTLGFTPSYGTEDIKNEIAKKKAEIADKLLKGKK